MLSGVNLNLYSFYMFLQYCQISEGSWTNNAELTTGYTEYIWHCSGPYSKLAYRDCQGSYYNTTGCYFKIHFSQYRPCSEDCNNVVVGSIDEEKCNAYCTGYLQENCEVRAFQDETTIRKIDESHGGKTESQAVTDNTPSESTLHSPVIISVSLAGVIIIAVVCIMIILLKKRKMNLCSRQDSTFPLAQGVQECEEVAIALNAEPRQCEDSVCATAQNESNDMKV